MVDELSLRLIQPINRCTSEENKQECADDLLLCTSWILGSGIWQKLNFLSETTFLLQRLLLAEQKKKKKTHTTG